MVLTGGPWVSAVFLSAVGEVDVGQYCFFPATDALTHQSNPTTSKERPLVISNHPI
jgi:hypothetical protein